MLAQLVDAKAALRVIGQTADRSAPNLRDGTSIEFEANAHENYFLDLGMDNWLGHVRDLTFETASLSLSPEEASLLRTCYDALHGSTEASNNLPHKLATELASSLGQRLEPVLSEFEASNRGVFAKLSGRSAKDSPLHTGRLDQALSQRFAADGGGGGTASLEALFDVSLELNKVRSVDELLWNLINSQRVDEDLDVALRHPERWDQSIVIRRWWAGVSSDLEFRLFCVDGEPTALTQYNHLIFSPRLATVGTKVAEVLRGYYERLVRPRLKGTSFFAKTAGRFTCDLALHPEALDLLQGSPAQGLGPEHIKLIELNCFYEATGMGLFDYHKDAHVLRHGPFEFRIREQPLPHAEVCHTSPPSQHASLQPSVCVPAVTAVYARAAICADRPVPLRSPQVKLENEWRALLRARGAPPRRLTDAARDDIRSALEVNKQAKRKATGSKGTW